MMTVTMTMKDQGQFTSTFTNLSPLSYHYISDILILWKNGIEMIIKGISKEGTEDQGKRKGGRVKERFRRARPRSDRLSFSTLSPFVIKKEKKVKTKLITSGD